jgi:thioesterase domain-containing protein
MAELVGGLLGEQATDLDLDADWAQLAQRMADLPHPIVPFGAERFARVLDAGIHSASLTSNYCPRRFEGDLVYFTAAFDDPTGTRGADTWLTAIGGIVDNHAVPTTHWRMTTESALAKIGKVLTTTRATRQSREQPRRR